MQELLLQRLNSTIKIDSLDLMQYQSVLVHLFVNVPRPGDTVMDQEKGGPLAKPQNGKSQKYFIQNA